MSDARAHWLAPDWSASANVRAVVTTRDGPDFARASPYGFNVGARCGDDPAAVARNRAFLRDTLALPSEPHWLRQVHGTRVIVLDRPHPDLPLGEGEIAAVCLPRPQGEGRREGSGNVGTEPEADAAVTCAPGVVLAIQTADCLPVLFCADDGSELAAAHAGWRGLSSGMLEGTLDAMRTSREHVIAWLGPAIAARSYEVGEDVREAFTAHDPASASAFTAARPGHWSCDLYELARQRLRAAGVTRVSGGGFDTHTDPRLHSYRRDRDRSGRMASLVWIDPEQREQRQHRLVPRFIAVSGCFPPFRDFVMAACRVCRRGVRQP